MMLGWRSSTFSARSSWSRRRPWEMPFAVKKHGGLWPSGMFGLLRAQELSSMCHSRIRHRRSASRIPLESLRTTCLLPAQTRTSYEVLTTAGRLGLPRSCRYRPPHSCAHASALLQRSFQVSLSLPADGSRRRSRAYRHRRDVSARASRSVSLRLALSLPVSHRRARTHVRSARVYIVSNPFILHGIVSKPIPISRLTDSHAPKVSVPEAPQQQQQQQQHRQAQGARLQGRKPFAWEQSVHQLPGCPHPCHWSVP